MQNGLNEKDKYVKDRQINLEEKSRSIISVEVYLTEGMKNIGYKENSLEG